MSSIAPAPLPPLDGDSAMQTFAPPVSEPPPAGVQPMQTTDPNGVDRLLAQLEARSLALVPYGYYDKVQQQARPRYNTPLFAVGLVLAWATSVIAVVAYVRSAHLIQVPGQTAASTSLMIPTGPDPQQEQQIATSVDHLTEALVSSSKRINQIEAALSRSNRELQRLKVTKRTEPVVAAAVPAEPKPAVTVTVTDASRDALPKNWHQVLELKPSEQSLAHRGTDGAIDYWLVPQNGDRSRMTKVLPVANSPDGVIVHSVEDGKDYAVGHAGEWKNVTPVTPPPSSRH